MIKIPYPNQQTLDTYFDEIKTELLKKISYIKSQKNISIDKKKFRVTSKIKKILVWLEDENNLKKLIQFKPNELASLIENVYKKFLHFKHFVINTEYLLIMDMIILTN